MARKKKPQSQPKQTKAPAVSVVPAASAGPAAAVAASAPTLASTFLPHASKLRPLVIDERAIALAVGLATTIFVLWTISGVLLPLLFTGVLTFVAAPAVAALAARGVPRAAGAAGVIVVGVCGITGLAALVVPALVRDLAILISSVPAVMQDLTARIEGTFHVELPTTFKELSAFLSKELSGDLASHLTGVAKSGGALVGQGAVGIFKGAASVLGFVGQAALIPILAFFVLSELPDLRKLVWALWPRRTRPAAAHYLPLMGDALAGLFRGQLTVATIMMVIYAIGLAIAGVPLSLAIAVLAGAAYLIPFASAAVCLVLAVAFSLLELGSGALGPIIGAGITALVVQLAEGYLLTPRIVGEKAGLSPLATLLAVLCGGSAAGFLGVLFALPVGAVTAIIVRDVARGRLRLTESSSEVPA